MNRTHPKRAHPGPARVPEKKRVPVRRAHEPDWPLALVSWFEAHARDLPWRRNHDPYRVWLSEVMLQQTQVDRVLDYFERWLERFPDIEAVAQAPIETILSLWQGLGYYSRARNFHRATQVVVEEYQGRLPNRFEDLVRLPGVGRYTAGAILAFAFNQPYPTIEANTERVYARITDEARNLKQRQVFTLMEERLRSWIPEGRARLFNQGLMELGSLVCTPTRPRCHECPLAEICLARAAGTQEQRPVLPPKKARIKVSGLALVALRPDRRILLFQRPQEGLWAGFWELPNRTISETDSAAGPRKGKGTRNNRDHSEGARDQALTRLLADLSPLLITDSAGPPALRHLGKVRHSYTRFSATLDCYLLELEPGMAPPDRAASVQPHRWVDLDQVADLPLHAGHRKCLALVRRWLKSGP